MSKHFHTVVWIDHRQAKILNFNADVYDGQTVRSTHPDQHLHHKANSGDSGHAPPDHEFFKHVAKSLTDAGAVLIVGPSSAKHELAKYIKDHEAPLAGRISGVETMDHPSEGTIVAFARHFFKADDRMHSQTANKT
jgi:stalled ribosome rescue protein Dom34